MRALIVLIASVAVLSLIWRPGRGLAAPAEQERPDWWKAGQETTDLLFVGNADLADLAVKYRETKPKTAQEAMLHLELFLRAGMPREAIASLKELKRLCPDLAPYQIKSIFYDLDHFAQWSVAQATLEVFADNVYDVTLQNGLIKHLRESGWTVEQVDQWLAGMPAGRENFWVKERLRFNVEVGRGDSLVQSLSDGVRKQPQDSARAVALLDALVYARHAGNKRWDLDWMAETLKPQRATEAEQIASRLVMLEQWAIAIPFYQKAIDTPLTDTEARDLRTRYAAVLPEATMRAGFAVQVREAMARRLLNVGRKAEAQKWMVEATDIRRNNHLSANAVFAGQVQAQSGQRVIEGRIKQEEKLSENDPGHWRERAQYYRGRNEPKLEEEALLKGLSVAKETADPNDPRTVARNELFRDYMFFLARKDRGEDAVPLLRKEIERAPPASWSAEFAVNRLTSDFTKHVRADDEALWNWLSQRPKWKHTEERLLWRMLESSPSLDLAKHFARAEQLAQGTDPSRAAILGWIMNRMKHARRSIPLLEQAVERATDPEVKKSAAFTLFESSLDTDDWQRAESIFPIARRQLTPYELPGWYAKIAVLAAKAGAKTDAIRIWRGAANLNPSSTGYLPELVKVGLKDALADYYRQMQKRLPSSEIPARAIRIIEGAANP